MRHFTEPLRLLTLLFPIICFTNTAIGQETQELNETSPTSDAQEETPTKQAPPLVEIPIVYTGGSMGIGSGNYHFDLPEEIRQGLGELGELANLRAYHGLLSQGPYKLIAQDRRVETLTRFLASGFITCGESNQVMSYASGHELMLVWNEGEQPEWTSQITDEMTPISYSVCSNANEQTATLIGPPLSSGPEINWSPERFEFQLGLHGQIRVGESTTQIDILGIPRAEPARRFRVLSDLIKNDPRSLFVDAGSFVDGASSVRAGALSLHRPTGFAILKRLGPTAMVPGETELAGGVASLLLEAAANNLDYIATNWSTEDPKLKLSPSLIESVETEHGVVRIAFLGAIDPGLHRWATQIARDGVRITEPIAAVAAEVKRLRALEEPPHAFVLLTSVNPSLLSQLRKELRYVDLILGDVSARSERLNSFAIELREDQSSESTATTLPVDGITSAKLTFEFRNANVALNRVDVSPHRVEASVEPDAEVTAAVSRVRASEYPTYDHPLLPAPSEGNLAAEHWDKIVCESIATLTNADAVFLTELPPAARIPGPLTELMVMDRLALLDQVEVHYIPGDRFPNFLQKVYGVMPIHCGADVGSKWPKSHGRFLEAERLYRVVTTDRARLTTDLGVLMQEAYSPKILDKPSYKVILDAEGNPVRLSKAVLTELRILRDRAENPLTIADELIARNSSDKPPMWVARVRRVALNIERFKGAEDPAYELIPETLATSDSSFTLGGQVDVAADYSSRLLLSDVRVRSNYTRLVLQEEEPQETADDFVLSSSISLPGAAIPKIGDVAFMPYSEGLLDSEFTAVETDDNTDVPRQADLSLAFGLSARRFGAVRTLRVGAFGLRDLSVPEKSMEFGARVDFETRHVFGPGLLFTTLWNGNIWGNTPEDDESDLRFRLLLDSRLSLPLARYLNIAIYGQGFLFQGRVPSTSDVGASYSLGVSFDVIGSFALEKMP